MATYDSALSDLSEMLLASDGSLSTSLAEIVATAVQELIEAELTARIGAEPGERSPIRSNQLNGHCPEPVPIALCH
jgi:transposase-like protein